MDLTEAENIRKRWQKYTELYKNSSWPRWSWWCDYSPRARHPGLWSQVGLSKHPNITSSVVPFSSHLQSFPATESFQINQFLASGGQNIGASASTSVIPMYIQDWFPLWWTGWISLQSKGLSIVFSNSTVQKHQYFGTQLSSQSNFHIHNDAWKNHGLN